MRCKGRHEVGKELKQRSNVASAKEDESEVQHVSYQHRYLASIISERKGASSRASEGIRSATSLFALSYSRCTGIQTGHEANNALQYTTSTTLRYLTIGSRAKPSCSHLFSPQRSSCIIIQFFIVIITQNSPTVTCRQLPCEQCFP